MGTVVKNVVIMKGYQPPEGFNLHGKETMLAFKRNPRAPSDNDPWPAVTFTRDRALWRDSFALMHSAGGDYQPPGVLKWLSDLVAEDVLPRDAVLPVDAFGLNSSQSKVFFWRHERFPVPFRYLADRNLVDSLKTALQLTEETAQGLGRLVWTMATNILAPDRPDVDRNAVRTLVNHLGADRAYWSRLEEPSNCSCRNWPATATSTESMETERYRPGWRPSAPHCGTRSRRPPGAWRGLPGL